MKFRKITDIEFDIDALIGWYVSISEDDKKSRYSNKEKRLILPLCYAFKEKRFKDVIYLYDELPRHIREMIAESLISLAVSMTKERSSYTDRHSFGRTTTSETFELVEEK